MMGFAVQIELANMVAVQCPHDADPREHPGPAERRDHDQGLHRRLPFRCLMLGLRQLGNVIACIPQGNKQATVGQRYRRARSPRGRQIIPALLFCPF